jgi:hypothetical protein
MRRLPRNVHNMLAKAQTDLEWAARMFNVSAVPECVDVARLVKEVEAALVAGQAAAIAMIQVARDAKGE